MREAAFIFITVYGLLNVIAAHFLCSLIHKLSFITGHAFDAVVKTQANISDLSLLTLGEVQLSTCHLLGKCQLYSSFALV